MPFSGKEVLPVTVLVAALKERDLHTFEHSDRTCGLALELGKSCALNRDELEILSIAALAHDIGKIGIPDSVLMKPGRLDDAEWEVIKTHPSRGSSILKASGLEIFEPVEAVILGHHEDFGGGGYPGGIAGEEIPVLSRIVALADVYDAMVETRPYHPPRSHSAIMKIMNEGRGVKFDPYLFDKFVHLIEQSDHRSTVPD